MRIMAKVKNRLERGKKKGNKKVEASKVKLIVLENIESVIKKKKKKKSKTQFAFKRSTLIVEAFFFFFFFPKQALILFLYNATVLLSIV